MITKSIRITAAEEAELHEIVARTGESEAAVLKRAALDGLQARALQDAITEYVMGRVDTCLAAELARMPRAYFIRELLDRGVSLLSGPSALHEELEHLGMLVGDERLLRALQSTANCTPEVTIT